MKTVFASTFLACAVLVTAATPPVPRPAKELTILEASGKQSLLTQYRGKVCVIQFLFTTCPHCQALSKELTKMQSELGPKGVQMIGIAFDDGVSAPAVANYVKQLGLQFPVGYANRDTVMSYLGLSVMDRYVVPQVLIVDKKGVVRAQTDPMGTADLQNPAYLTKFINGLLTEGPGKAPATTTAPKAPPPATKKNS